MGQGLPGLALVIDTRSPSRSHRDWLACLRSAAYGVATGFFPNVWSATVKSSKDERTNHFPLQYQ